MSESQGHSTESGIGDAPLLSVCVITYERPAYIARCLQSLVSNCTVGLDIVVVDASHKSAESAVKKIAPEALYIHSPELAGWMTRSRNEGLRWVRGSYIAFLDDDTVVRTGWDEALISSFQNPAVRAVAGRTCNGIDGEDHYAEPVGRLRQDGTLSEGFAADLKSPVEVDHGIGANMTFRRSVLSRLGGFRDDYPGTAVREDTDMFLRVRTLPGVTHFQPSAVVDHLPAPHVHGARFDARYKIYMRRNHFVLLARNCGWNSPLLRRWVGVQFIEIARAGRLLPVIRRFGVTLIGLAWGAAAAIRQGGWRGIPAERTDSLGQELRIILGER